MTIYDDVPDLEAENERLLTQALGVEAERDIARQEIERLRAALRKIANEDYRGNAPQSVFIARNALNNT